MGRGGRAALGAAPSPGRPPATGGGRAGSGEVGADLALPPPSCREFVDPLVESMREAGLSGLEIGWTPLGETGD